MEFTLTRTSSAPIEAVFDTLTAHRQVADWFWLCRRSTLEREGSPEPDGVGSVRRLRSFGTTFVEQTTEYERPTRWAYVMVSGTPTRDHRGTVDLRRTAGGTEVTWHLRSTVTVPGLDRLLLPTAKWFTDQLMTGAIAAAERPQVEAAGSGAAGR